MIAEVILVSGDFIINEVKMMKLNISVFIPDKWKVIISVFCMPNNLDISFLDYFLVAQANHMNIQSSCSGSNKSINPWYISYNFKTMNT